MFSVVLHAFWLISAHVGDEHLRPPWPRISSEGEPGHAKPELPLNSDFEVANASGLELVSAEEFAAATGSSCVFYCPPESHHDNHDNHDEENHDGTCDKLDRYGTRDRYGGLVACDALITRLYCFRASGFCGYCGDFRPAPEAETHYRCGRGMPGGGSWSPDVVELLPIMPNLEPRRSGAWKAAADGYPNPWRD